jgi:hypothetical protein
MPNTPTVNRAIGSPPVMRFGAITLMLSGLLFFLYPAVRPWHDESTVAGAEASMSSHAWVAAHLFAVFALILLPLGLLAICGLAVGRRGGRLIFAATVIIWLGVGLALPYYGAEDFALHAIARKAGAGTQLDLLGLVDAIRFGAAAASTFAIGLVLLGGGGVLLAVSIWRTAVLPRFSAVPLAVALVLMIPQFYLPPWARIAHGTLLGLALLWLAWVLWTNSAGVLPAGITSPAASKEISLQPSTRQDFSDLSH